MAGQLKVLGQAAPAAATLSPLYTCGSVLGASISTLTACNKGVAIDTFRISVAKAGASDSIEQYIYHDVPIAPHDTFACTIGIALSNTDVIRVQSANGDVAFNAFGMELS